MDEQDRHFVVGLGNPGRQYAKTRHNVGFVVLEQLRTRWQAGRGRESFEGICWNTSLRRPGAVPGDREQPSSVIMLAPMTWMNCSGRAVSKLLNFYKAAPRDVIVVYDDIALPTGILRCRPDGSSGGHKGLADIIRACDTECIPRLRIGVGQPPPGADAKQYVLSRFSRKEKKIIDAAVERAANAVEDWVFGNMQTVMEKYNNKRYEGDV